MRQSARTYSKRGSLSAMSVFLLWPRVGLQMKGRGG